MAKSKLAVKKEPPGINLYIVGVVESISKSKTILVHSDYFMLDDQDNVVFINKENGNEDYILVIRSGDWKTIIKHEEVDPIIKSVKFYTLQEYQDALTLIELEREENEKKVRELEELEEASKIESKATAELEKSIKKEE